MYISAYVFLLQVQVEAVVTVSAKYDVTYITWVHKRKKSDDGKNIQSNICSVGDVASISTHPLFSRSD